MMFNSGLVFFVGLCALVAPAESQTIYCGPTCDGIVDTSGRPVEIVFRKSSVTEANFTVPIMYDYYIASGKPNYANLLSGSFTNASVLTIEDCSNVKEITNDQFNTLEKIEHIELTENENLEKIDGFSSLKTVDTIYIDLNAKFGTLGGFEEIIEIDHYFELYSGLEVTISGFNKIKKVNGYMDFDAHIVTGFQELEEAGSFVWYGYSGNVKDASGFNKLKEITFYTTISQDRIVKGEFKLRTPGLTSISGFQSLTHVNGTLSFLYNETALNETANLFCGAFPKLECINGSCGCENWPNEIQNLIGPCGAERTACIESASPKVAESDSHRVVGGRQDRAPAARWSLNTEKHAVRCCSDNAVPGWKKTKNCPWTETDRFPIPGGCNEQATYEEAKQICEATTEYSTRLCTAQELEDDCTRGTGCFFDRKLVWSSESKSEAESGPALSVFYTGDLTGLTEGQIAMLESGMCSKTLDALGYSAAKLEQIVQSCNIAAGSIVVVITFLEDSGITAKDLASLGTLIDENPIEYTDADGILHVTFSTSIEKAKGMGMGKKGSKSMGKKGSKSMGKRGGKSMGKKGGKSMGKKGGKAMSSDSSYVLPQTSSTPEPDSSNTALGLSASTNKRNSVSTAFGLSGTAIVVAGIAVVAYRRQQKHTGSKTMGKSTVDLSESTSLI